MDLTWDIHISMCYAYAYAHLLQAVLATEGSFSSDPPLQEKPAEHEGLLSQIRTEVRESRIT
jgi:hypothetical protein